MKFFERDERRALKFEKQLVSYNRESLITGSIQSESSYFSDVFKNSHSVNDNFFDKRR